MTCIKCGGTMIGDGYNSPFHCEYKDISARFLEGDANPVYCDFIDEAHKILQQDDQSPDSLEVFGRDFAKITGFSIQKFKDKFKDTETNRGDHFIWISEEYQLEYHADDPFYKLYKIPVYGVKNV